MSETTLSKQGHSDVRAALAALDTDDAEYAVRFVDLLLDWCRAAQASDLHLQPTSIGLKVDCRLDGVLQNLGEFPAGGSTDPVARLKVMAQLLTYRRDVPQEGRIRDGVDGADMRVSTFPTLYGERAAVRFLGSDAHRWNLAELGLPEDTDRAWRQMLGNTAGALLITGPAGSGKTTTSYASLREIARQSRCGRSMLSMEDPIEAAVTGVAQSQVNEPAGFTLVEGLRSILRQDPEVIFVGEIRDADSAAIAMQAALTGQLVLTTFHAESPASAISRLINLGVPPYVVASAIRGILNQRLVRRLCKCSTRAKEDDSTLGLSVGRHWVSTGCAACHYSGYRGRGLIVELAQPAELGLTQLILDRADMRALERAALAAGMISRWQRAVTAIEAGLTSCDEVRRVLGFDDAGT